MQAKADGNEVANNAAATGKHGIKRVVEATLNFTVIALSAMLIVWISVDTFKKIDFLQSRPYMMFQLCVCLVFLADFFVELGYASDKWRFFRNRFLYLLLSIPYLNIINQIDIQLTSQQLYYVRFIPLARGALALSIVMGYISSNRITSLFMSYLVILLMVVYFCSLIFYQRESGINPKVDSYWTALWWAAMNMTTVGCDISPVTVAGKIVAVVLPVSGMIIFPLFTVYLTNFVSRSMLKSHDASESAATEVSHTQPASDKDK